MRENCVQSPQRRWVRVRNGVGHENSNEALAYSSGTGRRLGSGFLPVSLQDYVKRPRGITACRNAVTEAASPPRTSPSSHLGSRGAPLSVWVPPDPSHPCGTGRHERDVDRHGRNQWWQPRDTCAPSSHAAVSVAKGTRLSEADATPDQNCSSSIDGTVSAC